MKTKILLLIIATIFVGIALPVTFSLSTGQHTFQQIDPNNIDAFCNKCHGTSDIINTELSASGNGLYNGGMKIHSSVGCAGCHRLTNDYGTSTLGSKTEHAARIPSCTECHSPMGSAGFLGDVTTELETSTEAHKNFNTQTDDLACMACHTGVSVTGSISYTYSESINRNGLTIG